MSCKLEDEEQTTYEMPEHRHCRHQKTDVFRRSTEYLASVGEGH